MLDIKGSKNIEKIFELLYSNSPEFYLKRKYLRFETFNEYIQNITRRNIPDKIINNIKELYNKNIKQSVIAKQLSIPSSTIRCIIQRLRKQNIIR